jgi:hypothetical protein
MDSLNSIVPILLTSAVVSSAVSFLLETWFGGRRKQQLELELEKQRHSYEIELEKIRNELTVRADTTHELTERRLSSYPKIVELVYRIRNMAREIVDVENASPVLFDELRARARELEDNLFAYRMDLERDSMFLPVHTYKNAARTFNRMVEDRNHYLSRGENEQAHEVYEQMCILFAEIESLHKPIIEHVSSIIPSDMK